MNDSPISSGTRGQQQTWSEGDFAMVASLVVIRRREPGRSARRRPGERVLDVACGSGNGAIAAARRTWGEHGRRRLRAGPAGARPRARCRRAARDRVRRGRRPGRCPLTRPSRRGDLRLRRDVRPDQEAHGGRAAAGGQARRADRDGELDARGRGDRRPLSDRRQAHRRPARLESPPPPLWGLEERVRELFGDGISELRVGSWNLAPGLPLRRPLHKVLPQLFRSDQDRLRPGSGRRERRRSAPTCMPF